MHQTLHFGRTEKQIYFWQRIDELLFVTLDHAAYGNHRLALACVLVARCLDDGIDRFLLRRVDEATSVDDDDIGLLQLRRVLRRVIGELGEIPFAVDGVLVAAEGDETDLHAGWGMRDAGCGSRISGSCRT